MFTGLQGYRFKGLQVSLQIYSFTGLQIYKFACFLFYIFIGDIINMLCLICVKFYIFIGDIINMLCLICVK